MDQAAVYDVVDLQAGGYGESDHGDELRRLAADDAAAEDNASGRVGDYLDEATGVVVYERAG